MGSGEQPANKDILLDLAVKLDRVLSQQEAMDKRFSEKFDNLEATVFELTRTIRGFNGTPGLVTDVALLRQELDGMKYGQEEEKPTGDEDEQFITWKWLVDRGATIAIALITWLMLTFVPEVLKSIGKP